MCKGPGAGVSYQPLLLLPAACYIPALVATFSTSFFGVGQFQPIMYSLNKPSLLLGAWNTHMPQILSLSGRDRQCPSLIMRHFFCA